MAGKLSGAAVLLLVAVPLCMYTCALLVVGIQLGWALERTPDTSISFIIRGVLDFAAKELWDGGVFGRGRGGRSYMQQSKSKQHYTQWCPRESSAPPVAQRCNDKDYTSLLMQFQQQHMLLQRLTAQREVDLPGSQRSQHSLNVFASGRDNERSPCTRSTKHAYTPWSTLPRESRVSHTNHASPRGVISVGPWGGSGGQPFYMCGGSAPRLLRITVYHSPGSIHSLACEYFGDSSFRMAGPWGRPNSFASAATSGPHRAVVELSAGERLTAVEGTTGHFGDVPGEVVTSMTFRTSRGRTYGPYGGGDSRLGRGMPFSVPVADGACVAGFWGRSGWLLDAVGVYVSPCKYPANWYRLRSD